MNIKVRVFPFLLAAAVVCTACDKPRRIPRIEPLLHGWSEAYRGRPGLTLHIFDTGSLSLPSGALYKGGSWAVPRDLVASAFVIEHPQAGLLVFDTGLSPMLRTDPVGYVGWFMGNLGRFNAPEGADLPSQMRAAGLEPDEVSRVVVSHLHFDHTGTMEAFPNATAVVSSEEKKAAAAAPWMQDYFVGGDYNSIDDWMEIDYSKAAAFATFIAHHDLLGDGSVILVDLRGHTAGSQGMLLMMEGSPVLLTGDAAWVEENWRYAAIPSMAYDMDLWWEQIWRIKKFVQLVPDALIVAGHDLTTARRGDRTDVVLYERGGD